jgi:hypothetical protein
MRVYRNEIDSVVLGQDALEITEIAAKDDLTELEREFVREFSPFMATAKLPIEDLLSIHRLEEMGFRFIETQLKLSLRMKEYDVSRSPYRYLPVTNAIDLEAVLDMAGTIFRDDRFRVDPVVSQRVGANVAGERYRRYVEKSFREKDECVYKLVREVSGEIVGFGTHKHVSPEEVQLLLGGVAKAHQSTGLGAVADYLATNLLRREGARRVFTFVSARNYPIVNLEVAGLGFRVRRAFVVLRKVYG